MNSNEIVCTPENSGDSGDPQIEETVPQINKLSQDGENFSSEKEKNIEEVPTEKENQEGCSPISKKDISEHEVKEENIENPEEINLNFENNSAEEKSPSNEKEKYIESEGLTTIENVSTSQPENRTLEERMKALEMNVFKKEIELEEACSNMNKKIVNLKEENVTLEKKMINLKEENVTLAKNMVCLKEENVTLAKNMVDLKEENVTLAKNMVCLKEENVLLEKKITSVFETNLILQKEVLSLKDKSYAQEKIISALKDRAETEEKRNKENNDNKNFRDVVSLLFKKLGFIFNFSDNSHSKMIQSIAEDYPQFSRKMIKILIALNNHKQFCNKECHTSGTMKIVDFIKIAKEKVELDGPDFPQISKLLKILNENKDEIIFEENPHLEILMDDDKKQAMLKTISSEFIN